MTTADCTLPADWDFGGSIWTIATASDTIAREDKPVWIDPAGSFTLHALDASDARVLVFAVGADFLVEPNKKRITVSKRSRELSAQSVRHLLLDQVIPRVAATLRDLVLHAAGVLHEDHLLLFLGDTGRGKSTLAASLSARGALLLGDDALIVSHSQSGPTARAVYPSLRLNPDSLHVLGSAAENAVPMADYSRKQSVQLGEESIAQISGNLAPITAIFVIGEEVSESAVSVTQIGPQEASMELVRHSFALDPNDTSEALRRMRTAAKLCETVQAFSLTYPRDYDCLPQVHAAIFAAAWKGSR